MKNSLLFFGWLLATNLSSLHSPSKFDKKIMDNLHLNIPHLPGFFPNLKDDAGQDLKVIQYPFYRAISSDDKRVDSMAVLDEQSIRLDNYFRIRLLLGQAAPFDVEDYRKMFDQAFKTDSFPLLSHEQKEEFIRRDDMLKTAVVGTDSTNAAINQAVGNAIKKNILGNVALPEAVVNFKTQFDESFKVSDPNAEKVQAIFKDARLGLLQTMQEQELPKVVDATVQANFLRYHLKFWIEMFTQTGKFLGGNHFRDNDGLVGKAFKYVKIDPYGPSHAINSPRRAFTAIEKSGAEKLAYGLEYILHNLVGKAEKGSVTAEPSGGAVKAYQDLDQVQKLILTDYLQKGKHPVDVFAKYPFQQQWMIMLIGQPLEVLWTLFRGFQAKNLNLGLRQMLTRLSRKPISDAEFNEWLTNSTPFRGATEAERKNELNELIVRVFNRRIECYCGLLYQYDRNQAVFVTLLKEIGLTESDIVKTRENIQRFKDAGLSAEQFIVLMLQNSFKNNGKKLEELFASNKTLFFELDQAIRPQYFIDMQLFVELAPKVAKLRADQLKQLEKDWNEHRSKVIDPKQVVFTMHEAGRDVKGNPVVIKREAKMNPHLGRALVTDSAQGMTSRANDASTWPGAIDELELEKAAVENVHSIKIPAAQIKLPAGLLKQYREAISDLQNKLEASNPAHSHLSVDGNYPESSQRFKTAGMQNLLKALKVAEGLFAKMQAATGGAPTVPELGFGEALIALVKAEFKVKEANLAAYQAQKALGKAGSSPAAALKATFEAALAQYEGAMAAHKLAWQNYRNYFPSTAASVVGSDAASAMSDASVVGSDVAIAGSTASGSTAAAEIDAQKAEVAAVAPIPPAPPAPPAPPVAVPPSGLSSVAPVITVRRRHSDHGLHDAS